MKKYKKNTSKKRSILKFFIAMLVFIIVLGITAIIYIAVNNDVTYVVTSDISKDVSDDEAKMSTPIIVNNLLFGGVYNKKFVSLEKYYLHSNNKKDFEILMYGNDGKIGEYKISNIYKSSNNNTVNVTTSKENLILEYYATEKKNTNALNKLIEVSANSNDLEISKKAIGLYRILNTSMKVSKVYETNIYGTNKIRIISVTSEPKKGMGAYSALIAYDTYTKKATCIKYNYVRNKNKSENFGILCVKFVCDLNSDGVNEIIIQDTKEFNTKYSIMKYEKGKYVEILSSTQKII